MVAWLVLLGVLLVPSAAFLLWSWRSSRNDMALMRATETTPAAHVAKLPPGAWSSSKAGSAALRP